MIDILSCILISFSVISIIALFVVFFRGIKND